MAWKIGEKVVCVYDFGIPTSVADYPYRKTPKVGVPLTIRGVRFCSHWKRNFLLLEEVNNGHHLLWDAQYNDYVEEAFDELGFRKLVTTRTIETMKANIVNKILNKEPVSDFEEIE